MDLPERTQHGQVFLIMQKYLPEFSKHRLKHKFCHLKKKHDQCQSSWLYITENVMWFPYFPISLNSVSEPWCSNFKVAKTCADLWTGPHTLTLAETLYEQPGETLSVISCSSPCQVSLRLLTTAYDSELHSLLPTTNESQLLEFQEHNPPEKSWFSMIFKAGG